MYQLKKVKHFFFSEYIFLTDLTCFLLILPHSDDLQTVSLTEDLSRFILFTCVTSLYKPKQLSSIQNGPFRAAHG